MRTPRGLSADEAALWARVASTVRPLKGRKAALATGDNAISKAVGSATQDGLRTPSAVRLTGGPEAAKGGEWRLPVAVRPLDRDGLDASWERRLAKALVQPDFTLDLHGHSLETAHARLEHGLALAVAQGARLVLVITGRPRPADAADRGSRRGAIRANLIDWLAAGSHASRIAAVRPAHQRHGGTGAVYIVLRRSR